MRVVRISGRVQASNVARNRPGRLGLVLYSKPDCSLCDGMKEKLEAVMDASHFTSGLLSNVDLEVRDISINPAWWEAHGNSVPVLYLSLAGEEVEVKLPKPVVRLNASRLGKRIEDQIREHLQHE